MPKVFKQKLTPVEIIFTAILVAIFFLRIPSLFEPYWYGDEGIFAAVARNMNLGGVLYDTAWDNKPPLIYLTYSSIFKFFGVSMFNIKFAALLSVLSTATLIYLIGKETFGQKRGLVAMAVFGILTSLRVFEGNLALTEIFMILLTTGAIYVSIKRKFDYPSLLVSGIMIGTASLYKQVGALEAAAVGIYLFFISKHFLQFFKKGFVLSLGFVVPLVITSAVFASKGLFGEYIFAAYTYYSIYLDESPQYTVFINILKYLPVILAISYGLYRKKTGEVTVYNLFLLWLGLSFLGSYFSGRAYGHYMVQVLPALSVAISGINLKLNKASLGYVGAIILILLIQSRLLFPNVFTWNPTDQTNYYKNFLGFSRGNIGVNEYNDFFDRNVNSIMAASDFLRDRNAQKEVVYIWGDLPWIYATSDVWNPSRYVTSFHVFGVPNGKEEVIADLINQPPMYILKPPSSIGNFYELENIIGNNYTLVSNVQGIDIYTLKPAIQTVQ